MITAFREWLRKRALARAAATCDEIAGAALLAAMRGDFAAARYFEAELRMANNRRDALRGHPDPGRYCCDQRCEKQGRRNCACELLPPLPRKATT